MGQHYGQLCNRVLDEDGFVRTLNKFGQIYDSGQEHGFIDWFRQRNIIIMDDIYTGNGSSNASH
jgi:hypothetical protein